jgi:outer membrane protein
VQAERQIELEARRLESTRINLEATQRLLLVGAQDPLAVLTAELETAQAEQNLELARGQARITRLALMDAMGAGLDLEFTLADQLPDVFDPSQLDAGLLVEAAVSESPTVMQVSASAEQTRYSLAGARAERWPTVSANLGIYRGSQLGNGSDPLFYLNPLNQTYSFSLNVGFSLFDRFQSSNLIAQERANYAVALEGLRATQMQTETAVRGAIIELQNVYRSLLLLDRSAVLARQQLELSQQKFRLGSMNFSELQISVDAAYQAEYDALSARFDFANAVLTLEEAVGAPVR